MDNQTTNQGLPNIAGGEVVAQFAKSLIEEKGLTNLAPEQQARLQRMIEEKTIELVNQAIIYALPDDRFDELEKMMDQPDVEDSKIIELIEGSGLDLSKIATEVMNEFRQAYLNSKKEEA